MLGFKTKQLRSLIVSSPFSWDFFIERLGFRDYHLYLAAAVIAFSTNVAFFPVHKFTFSIES